MKKPNLPALLFVLLAGVAHAAEKESVSELRAELNQLKTESNQRIEQLEKELDAVKQAQPATTTLSEEEIQKIQSQLDRQTLDFEFEGYMRAGYGVDGHGNAMGEFKAPNAESKYRLGNEAETYLETTFITHAPPEIAEDNAFSTQVRLAYSIPNANNNNYDTTFSLREAFGTATGILGNQPKSTFWAGQRFYSRTQIHMTDFWYRDMSGYGGGIENIDLNGDAKLAFAWIGGSIDQLDSDGSAFENPDGQFRKDNLDLVLSDVDLLNGTFRTELTYSYFNGSTLTNGTGPVKLNNSHGAAINLYQENEFKNGLKNLAVLQYGVGAAYNFKALLQTPTGLNTALLNGSLDTDDFRQFRILDDVTYDTGGPITYTAVGLYQEMELGNDQGRVRWGSAGIRPMYHFTKNVSLATEAGYDYTDHSKGDHGGLFKLTLAPQITPQMSVLSRPSLRLFCTYAWWSDGFQGQVGSPAQHNDTSGLSCGVQLETWW